MCFSAQVEQKLKTLKSRFGAKVDDKAFVALFSQRLENAAIKIPKALEANFDEPQNVVEKQIHDLIAQYRYRKTQALESELFAQKTRLATAQRKLRDKETKGARNHERIATKKIAWHLKALDDLKRTTLKEADSRIFPFQYAPVVVKQDGELLIRPMRYHCRPAGKPAFYDRKFDGLYNARRDNLSRFWKEQVGSTHAIVLIWGFYENVARHDFEQRPLAPGEKPENLVLHFNPSLQEPMSVACLWSHWEGDKEPPLESFAAITDEPPPEVAATGHDRCVVVLTPEGANRWLDVAASTGTAVDNLLDLRPSLTFEHRIAA